MKVDVCCLVYGERVVVSGLRPTVPIFTTCESILRCVIQPRTPFREGASSLIGAPRDALQAPAGEDLTRRAWHGKPCPAATVKIICFVYFYWVKIVISWSRSIKLKRVQAESGSSTDVLYCSKMQTERRHLSFALTTNMVNFYKWCFYDLIKREI